MHHRSIARCALAALATLIAAPGIAHAGTASAREPQPFSGAFEARGGKSRQTGMVAVFSMEMLQRGQSVCGRADASSTEKVDFTWIVGRVDHGVAVVEYTSNFYLEDVGRGTADLRVTPGGLSWDAREPTIRGYIWSSAKVRRQPWGKGRRALVADWCATHWADIDAGRAHDIVLRETEPEMPPEPDPFAVPPKE